MNWISISLVLLAASFARSDPIDKAENANRLATCGKVTQTKVLHGRTSQQSESPWSVFLQVRKATSAHICTGTLVSSRHILTATHCFFNGQNPSKGFEIMHIGTRDNSNCVGEDYVMKDPKYLKAIFVLTEGKSGRVISQYPEKVTFVNACVARNAQPGTAQSVYDDFAIIDLYDDVSFSTTIHPACVPSSKNTEQVGQVLQYYGFGNDYPGTSIQVDNTGVLRHETTTIISYPQLPNYFFLARNAESTTVTCQGDSGGGAWLKDPDNSNRATVIGALSQTNCEKIVVETKPLDESKELYASVAFYSDKICKLTGVCKDDAEHAAKLPSYVKQAKAARTTESPRTSRPNVGGGDDSDDDETENHDEPEAQTQEEPDGATQNVPLALFALLIYYLI